MINVVVTIGYAILIFALAGEAESGWLRVLGFAAAAFLTVIGALAGWAKARE